MNRIVATAGLLAALGLGAAALSGCGAPAAQATAPQSATLAVTEVTGDSPIEIGRYLVRTGGCNDCHAVGYKESGGNIPESAWLTGNPVGYRGPWGVTYAPNLRMTVAAMNREAWIAMLQTRNGAPPMPWPSVKAMTTSNQAALYDYIRSLGPAGVATPPDVPPGQDPTTPYENMLPVNADGSPMAMGPPPAHP